MSLEPKWRIAGWHTPGVLEAIPRVSQHFYEALIQKGHTPCKDTILERVYAAYHREDEDLTLLVVGPCAVLVSVVKPWWSQVHILSEEAMIRLEPTGSFADALAGLEAFARDIDCGAVTISDTASRSSKAYTRLLGMHGYRLATNQHVKEIHNG